MKSTDAQKRQTGSTARSNQPFFGTAPAQAFFAPGQAVQRQPFFKPSGTVPAVQAKLTVGAVGDQYEQEADRVAAAVVDQIHSPAPEPAGEQQAVQRMGEEEEELQTKPLQRMEEEDELQMSPLAESIQRMGEEEDELQMKPLQREVMEDEEELQMKPMEPLQREAMEEDELQMMPLVQRVGAEGGEVSADFERELNAARGGGQNLAPDLQAQMGQAMGADFSGVRVHTDGQADGLNRAVGARAFTTGQDLFFKRGEYQPGSRGGQELIAHELTHVVQQGMAKQKFSSFSNKPHAIQREIHYPEVPEEEKDPRVRINIMIDQFNESLPGRYKAIDFGLYHEIMTAIKLVGDHKITHGKQISRGLTKEEKVRGMKGHEQMITTPTEDGKYRELDFVYTDDDGKLTIVEAKRRKAADTHQVTLNKELATRVGGKVLYSIAGDKASQIDAIRKKFKTSDSDTKIDFEEIVKLEFIIIPADDFGELYNEGVYAGLAHIPTLRQIMDENFNPDSGDIYPDT
jgi:hypothetical protein